MKYKILGVLICIMLIASYLTVATTVDTVDFKMIKQTEIDVSSFEADLPEWSTGDKWTYEIQDININIAEENKSFYVHLEIDDLPLEVVDNTSEYNVYFKAKIKGNFSIYIKEEDNSTIDIDGKLTQATLEGNIYFTKSELGITKVDYILNGILTVQINELPKSWNIPNILLIIPIPAKVSTVIDFETPYTVLKFPMEIGNSWGLPETNFTINGELRSLWLTILKIINDIASLFGYKLIPEEYADLLPIVNIKEVLETRNHTNKFNISEIPTIFACFKMDKIKVLAGEYDAYNISIAPINETFALGRIYYSPELKNIIKVSGHLGDILPLMTSIKMELKKYEQV